MITGEHVSKTFTLNFYQIEDEILKSLDLYYGTAWNITTFRRTQH